MLITRRLTLLLLAWLLLSASLMKGYCQQSPPAPFGPLPTIAQLAWQETEMYCIVHFSMATFTDKEWGYGDEDPSLFNPSAFDAGQIVGAARSGGFRGVIVVAKHHDGFCLWPTATTGHNIRKSPFRNGKGDLMAEYKKACEKWHMRLGVYCSPWDRNNAAYGTAAYPGIYRAQLTELLSRYGNMFIIWHDGANGGDGYYGGAQERRSIERTSYYGWDSTWNVDRLLQPGAVIFGDVGPDIRWVGNEKGRAGSTCWATFSPEAPDPGKRPANGYCQTDKATEGTRNGLYWMPAECDVPLRPGWFYHASQDTSVKSPAALLDLYYNSVGHGACLDLGLSPDTRGQLHREDVASLKAFGDILRQTFSVNFMKGATFKASNIRGNDSSTFGTAHLTDQDRYSYWATDDSVLNPTLEIFLPGTRTFNVIRLRENIKLGQRIDSFAIDSWQGSQWKEMAAATTIGACRLIRLTEKITASRLRLRIMRAEACITLSDLGLFLEQPVVLQ